MALLQGILFLFLFWPLFSAQGMIENICSTPEMDSAQNGVKKIAILNPNTGKFIYGSGYFPRSNLYLTAFHVVDEMPEDAQVYLDGMEGLSLKLVRVSKIFDLALFEVDHGQNYLANIAQNTPMPEEELCIMGFPDRVFSRIGKSYPTFYSDDYNYEFAVNKSDIFFGLSGGPVLNGKGEITGMVTQVVDGGNTVLVTTPNSIADFMDGTTGLNCNSSPMNNCIAKEAGNFTNLLQFNPPPYIQYLAFMHYRGDFEIAITFLKKSADGGYPLAQYLLGRNYLDNGYDAEIAFAYIELAFEQQHNLAKAYTCKNYYLPNPNRRDEGLQCLRFLAESYGFAVIQHHLGEIYLYGIYGIEPDLELARKYLTMSIAQGNERSKYLLHVIEFLGH